ncbi:MAG: hypothetical protein Q8P54_01825 [bacterium]|nr:hypothetical protein [bacterium]
MDTSEYIDEEAFEQFCVANDLSGWVSGHVFCELVRQNRSGKIKVDSRSRKSIPFGRNTSPYYNRELKISDIIALDPNDFFNPGVGKKSLEFLIALQNHLKEAAHKEAT